MKTLYFECNMGAAGDMLAAALFELIDDKAALLSELNGMGLDGVHFSAEPSEKCGITGTHFSVHTIHGEEGSSSHTHEHAHPHAHDGSHAHTHEVHTHAHDSHSEHTHAHNTLEDVLNIIHGLKMPKNVLTTAAEVYTLLAQAESTVHGKPVADVHFHEVGRLDAIGDIVAVCRLMDIINPDLVLASPITTGKGTVRCAHGLLPVPAPATAILLSGIPSRSGEYDGELCTPTGAALLRKFVAGFGDRPVMAATKVGYGMGKKDFPAANCVRVFFAENAGEMSPNGEVCVLDCNLDDMTPEALGFALELLLENGALDAFITPILMKKSRPGQRLTCVCRTQDEAKLAELILRHTSTFGLRVSVKKRYMLTPEFHEIETKYGKIQIKTGRGYGVVKTKPEYADAAAAARASGAAFSDVAFAATVAHGASAESLSVD